MKELFLSNVLIIAAVGDIFARNLAVIQGGNLNISRLPSQKCSKELKISRINGVQQNYN